MAELPPHGVSGRHAFSIKVVARQSLLRAVAAARSIAVTLVNKPLVSLICSMPKTGVASLWICAFGIVDRLVSSVFGLAVPVFVVLGMMMWISSVVALVVLLL